MGSQGFPGEGPDKRAFGFLAPLIRKLSWHTQKKPAMKVLGRDVAVSLWPPYFVANWKTKDGQWRLARIGWRFDSFWKDAKGNAGGYILGAAGPFKKIQEPLRWY